MSTQTAIPGTGFIYNDAAFTRAFELEAVDTTTERTWLVFGLGTPSVRLLTEAERVREVDAHDVMLTLSAEWFAMWDSAPAKRWVLAVTATEYDLLDVCLTDRPAGVIGYTRASVAAEPELTEAAA